MTSLLLAVGLLLSAGCADNPSGDTNPENQINQAPGQPGNEPTNAPTP